MYNVFSKLIYDCFLNNDPNDRVQYNLFPRLNNISFAVIKIIITTIYIVVGCDRNIIQIKLRSKFPTQLILSL